MNNWIPFAALAFIVLFVFAFVWEARKQKAGRAAVYKSLARQRGWTYTPEDRGPIQRIAGDFEAIGQFQSPSLGKVIPKNVVTGRVDQGDIYLFQHSRRIYEGYRYYFDVCLIRAQRPIATSLVVRFKRGKSKLDNPFYTARQWPAPSTWAQHVDVFADDAAQAAQVLPDAVLRDLVNAAERLPWRIDLEVRKERVAAYIVERNASAENSEQLEQLIAFTEQATALLTSSKPGPV